jgi:hypothetical protein
VGAPSDEVDSNAEQGSAYVFEPSGLWNWEQQAKLTAVNGAVEDWFGWSVALDSETALVGAYHDDVSVNENQGSVYVYTRSGTTWSKQMQLTAVDGAAEDTFGKSVAFSGDTALVGAFNDDVGANSGQGSVYFYDITFLTNVYLPLVTRDAP